MFYFDWTYFILVLPAVIFAVWAQGKVSSTYKRYSKYSSEKGITGAEAARAILDKHSLFNVSVEKIAGSLTDHYDPRDNVIRLSEDVYFSRSVAAIGVAAHEAGHAVQYSENYSPVRLRNGVLPAAQIGTYAAYPLAILGLMMRSSLFINIGIILFAVVFLFQIFTLPVEYDASKRAVAALENAYMLNSQELMGVKNVLNAAALTYVAATAVALMNLIRVIALRDKEKM